MQCYSYSTVPLQEMEEQNQSRDREQNQFSLEVVEHDHKNFLTPTKSAALDQAMTLY